MLFKLRRPIPVLAAALVALALVSGSTSAPHAGSADAHSIAVSYLGKNAADFGVDRADVSDLLVTSQYTSSTSRITHVNLNQSYDGLEVFGGHVTVNVGANGRVVFAGGDLVDDLSPATSATPELDAVAAVEAAADALDLDEPEDLEVLSRKGGKAQETVVSDGGIAEEAIPARLGWQPTEGGLRLAWQLVIDEASEASLWKANIDANTGKLLEADDWTIHHNLNELKSTLGASSNGTTPSGTPVAAPPQTVDDGSSYRVFAVPMESPNDGDRVLLTNPADALASPFGWHDTDGLPGAEFTITRGNNVHAYFDQDANNAADAGHDADGGGGLDFDYPVDLNEHAQAYRDAVVTNLFYGCNAFHDIYYRYGFDEVSGNFQANNYGRGGLQGDYVRCEAADGGGTNNANFSTPTEPTPGAGVPRMQMFLWPGNQLGAQNQVVVGGATTFDASWARFGPPASVAGTTGPLFDAGNGCLATDYAAAPAGFVAIVNGNNTGCQNIVKARTAEAAGAAAVIVAHTTTAAAPVLTGSLATAGPAIPTVSVTQANGNAIRASLPGTAQVRKHPDHPGIRDGDFDNGIIFHEYGHGLSLRLTGGPTINCLGGNEQMGEGWSDYAALGALYDPALENPDAQRGLVPYALFQPNRAGNGLRPRPYTRNMVVQPFTYDSIKTGGWLVNPATGNATSLAVPHGIGHGWAAILLDMQWDLTDKHGFSGNVYAAWDAGGNNRALQYVVDGLKLQGCNPTFVRGRDAILASANTLGGGGEVAGDSCSIWASFARRGVGFSAVGGGTGRDDNTEAFDTNPSCRRGFLAPITPDSSYGALNDVVAGDARPLRFTADGVRTLDILATNSPYSRQVDCTTLKPVQLDPPRLTPKAYPEATSPPGKASLSVSATGVYNYPWKTEAGWAGTCREFVLTRKDGRQHRAFFRFLAG